MLDGFPRTVHELLVVPETGLAYVPIFGDGIHGRNPNPQHLLCVFDLEQARACRRPSICGPTSRRIRSSSGPTG